jgi:hypothetical protein
MLNFQNDTQAVFETFLADLQENTTTPFMLQYFKALNEAGNIDFIDLVKSRFPEYFTRLKDDASLLMVA